MGLKSEPVMCFRGRLLEGALSFTLFTTNRRDFGVPAVCDYRTGTNSDVDFILNMEEFLEMGMAPPGDSVVYDGAPGHTSVWAEGQIRILEQQYDVTFVRQPTHSPEMNMCEYIFQDMKNFMRRRRRGSIPDAVIEYLAGLTFQKSLNFCRHVVHF